MSNAGAIAYIVFQITLAIGQHAWKHHPINCVMQNKPVRLVITGSHAAALGNALKIHLPSITLEFCPITVAVVLILLTVLSMGAVQPLVDVLNVALGRGYEARVRYKKKGPGAGDDELIFELVP